MAERLSEEEKIRIIQEVIETGNQAEVAKKYGRSTGIVSNLMNEFRRGTGVLPGIGIFSDELQDFARLKRQENFSYADLVNLLRLGKVAKDLGLDNEILYDVSNNLKDLTPVERDEFYNVFKEINKLRKPGESILITEKNLKSDMEKLRDTNEKLENLSKQVKELQERKNGLEKEKKEMEEDIEFSKSITELIGAVDRKNVLSLIESLKKADFDADKFIRISNKIKKLADKGITVERFFEINDMLEALIGKGLSIEILNGIEGELAKSNKSFTDFITELKDYLKDKDNYMKNIEMLKGKNENLVKENKELERKQTKLKEEISFLTGQKQELENEIKSKKSELDNVLLTLGLANDINALKANKLIYSNLYNSEKSKYDSLIREKEKLESDLKNLEDEINKAKQQREDILKYKIAIENGIRNLDDLGKKIKELESKKNSLEGKIEKIRKEIESNKQKIENSEEFFNIMKYGRYVDQKSLRDICQLVINALPNLPEYMPKEVQARAHELLLNITNDAVVQDLNKSIVQVLTKKEYDDLMSVRTENMRIKSESISLKDELDKLKGNIMDELKEMAKNGTMNEFWQGILIEGTESAIKSILETEFSKNKLTNLTEITKNIAENIGKIVGKEVEIPQSDQFNILFIAKDGSIRSAPIKASDILDAVLHDKDFKINNEEINICDVLKGVILGAIEDKGIGFAIAKNNKPIKTFDFDKFKKQ
ncbi:MAG: hypothetical protein ACP5R3_06645 [Thermoplasmata archaeon]